MPPLKSLARLAGVLLVGVASFALAHTLASDARAERVAAGRRADSLAAREGPGLVVVYIGSSRCPWCRDPKVPGLLREIHANMIAVAESLGVGYRMVGLAVDQQPERGLGHLGQVGPMFSEVSSGGEWQGLAVSPLLWGALAGEAGTPQVIVLRRTVRRMVPDSGPVRIEIAGEAVLRRLVGLNAIEQWVNAGQVLETVDSSQPQGVAFSQ
ncbi:MAG: hypothetical protein JNM53_10525 [Gemmatimonadetes bacterium]|nr:hypothetical protein [Gemmatimonadota bacterium]